MAQKVTVVLEDDLTGGPAEQTVRFCLRGHRLWDRPERQERRRVRQATRALHWARPQGWAGTVPSARPNRGWPSALRWYPGLGETARPDGQWARAHPGQRGGAVPRGQRAL